MNAMVYIDMRSLQPQLQNSQTTDKLSNVFEDYSDNYTKYLVWSFKS